MAGVWRKDSPGERIDVVLDDPFTVEVWVKMMWGAAKPGGVCGA